MYFGCVYTLIELVLRCIYKRKKPLQAWCFLLNLHEVGHKVIAWAQHDIKIVFSWYLAMLHCMETVVWMNSYTNHFQPFKTDCEYITLELQRLII